MLLEEMRIRKELAAKAEAQVVQPKCLEAEH